MFTITPSTSPLFEDFLLVEYGLFGNDYPLTSSDPKLNLPTLYRFALEALNFIPEYTVVTLGQQYTLLGLHLAFRGGVVLSVGGDVQKLQAHVEKTANVKLRWRSQSSLANIESGTADRLVAFNPTQAELTESLRVLKPGGIAVVNYAVGSAPNLDNNSSWRIVKKQFVKDKMPLESANPHEFADFWQKTLTPAERQKWAWATPLFADVFNSITDAPDNAHTVLYVLEKA